MTDQSDAQRSKLVRSFLQSGESNTHFQDFAPSIFSTAAAPSSPRLGALPRKPSMRFAGPPLGASPRSTSPAPGRDSQRDLNSSPVPSISITPALTPSQPQLSRAMTRSPAPASPRVTRAASIRTSSPMRQRSSSSAGMNQEPNSGTATPGEPADGGPSGGLAFSNVITATPPRSPMLSARNSSTVVPIAGSRTLILSDEDFSTVDWTRESEREKVRKQELRQALDSGDRVEAFLQWIGQAQAWLLLALVGCALGVCSSWVQLVWTWLDSLRSGYCIGNIFLHQAACCGCSVITGGSAISDSALHPPDPTAVFNNGTSNSVLEQLGSLDCQDFRSWTQVYMLWTHMQSSDTNGSTFWNGATPAYWFGYAVYVLSGALMAVLGVWLVLTYGKFARASGLPEIKTVLGGIVMRKFLGAWTLFIKMLGCVLAVGSGLVLGVEGPFIHIACCIANIATRFFPKFHVNEGKKREVFAAASAAGVAVAFGAPVGGVLFSLEELSSYFPHTTLWRSFFCAVVAIIAIAFADPLQTGELVWFKIGFRNSWSWYEMLPFCLIGVLGGLVGAAMIKLNFRVARFLDTTSWGRHPLIEVFFVAVFTNMLRFPFVLLRGSTYHFLSSLFSDCRHPDQRLNMLCDLQNTDPLYTAGMLAMFGLLMAIFVCISFGSWIPGGIYVPSLLIGACFGRAVGVLLAQFYQSNPASTIFYNCHADASVSCITPGIYAIVGAAAVLGGVTRMTVSLSVIMFELTGGLIYALPIFCAVMIAKWVGDAFSVDSIHDMYITLYDFPHLDHKINVPSTNITIGDVMAHDLFVLPMHGHTIESLRLVLDSVDLSGFPIVTSDDERLLVGYAARSELEVLLENASSQRSTTRCYFAALEMRFPKSAPFVDLSPCVDTAPMQVAEHMSFERVFHMFRTLGLGYCLITRAGKLIGVLTKKDILRILKTSS